MTTLYRSPSHLVDGHEWYAAVEMHQGKAFRVFRFRPHGPKRCRWSPLSQWPGSPPKALREFFRPYFHHMDLALRPVQERRACADGRLCNGKPRRRKPQRLRLVAA